MIEICTLGGYNEVGKNCTAINIDGEVILMDLGLHLEEYIKFTEERDDLRFISSSQLIKAGAVPDIRKIEDWRKNVKAIVPTHAHLDHIGAIPFLSNKFKADILCTPYAGAVLKAILKDERINLKNKIKVLNTNSIYTISKNIKIEFINMTHSTPQTVMVAIHTKYGVIIYGNDFKFDSSPTLGKKPNFERLKKLGEQGVLALIVDSIYSSYNMKTPSEGVAKALLRDVMLGTDSHGKCMIVTTFSSHLARLKSIIECGKQLKRKIVFLGRSLGKYVEAGEKIGLVNFSKDVEIVKYGKHIKRKLSKISRKDKENYLLVVTGHQAEPRAVLSRMIDGQFDFKFEQGDIVVFSCSVIPTETNIRNRKIMDEKLKRKGVRIFTNIHVSGHAAREDDRDLISMTHPKHIIPAHAEDKKKAALIELADELGYKKGKTSHMMHNGNRLKLA